MRDRYGLGAHVLHGSGDLLQPVRLHEVVDLLPLVEVNHLLLFVLPLAHGIPAVVVLRIPLLHVLLVQHVHELLCLLPLQGGRHDLVDVGELTHLAPPSAAVKLGRRREIDVAPFALGFSIQSLLDLVHLLQVPLQQVPHASLLRHLHYDEQPTLPAQLGRRLRRHVREPDARDDVRVAHLLDKVDLLRDGVASLDLVERLGFRIALEDALVDLLHGDGRAEVRAGVPASEAAYHGR
jgi:hypothetical protein